ncbi:MAG: hypothetical protein WCI38_05750 [Chthoniobacterales bacterium]
MLRKTTFCWIGLSIALLSVTSAEENVLTVTNGDFSDLTDLQQMADGWYAGIPAGWTATASSEGTNNYAIRNQAGNFVANVSALSQTQPAFAAFEQEVGQLSAPGEVTVTFEIREPWHDPDFLMGAAIYDCMNVSLPLAFGDFTNSGSHTLVASNVSAGTRLKIGFWSVRGFPALDDVVVTFKPNE